MFKVGDYVKGLSDEYGVTNKGMLLGVVTAVYEDIDDIEVQVLRHVEEEWIGKAYPVASEDFCKVNERK